MSMLPADIHRRLEGAPPEPMSACPHGVPHRYPCEDCVRPFKSQMHGEFKPVENDIEEQGYSLISDGCTRFECQEWDRLNEVVIRPKLVKERGIGRGAPYYWVCPKCHGSYGEVR